MPDSLDKNKKYLVVTADDFGLTKGVNFGIIEGFQKGLITGASLMVSGDAFEDAVQKAKENPELAVGIHLTLAAGKSLLPPRQIPTLVDEEGNFYPGYTSFFYYLSLGKIRQSDIQRELQAQIEKFLDAGLKISHLDAHLHIHLHPSLISLVLYLAQKYRVSYIRCSEEMRIKEKRLVLSRWIKTEALRLAAGMARKKILKVGLKTSTYFYGIYHSGRFTEETWLTFLPQVKEGITEVMCHPGYEDEELYQQVVDPTYRRKDELKSLTSPKVKEMIARLNIELTNYVKLNQIR
jgi:hopanoid biosynthesis associated protein HpnK